MLSTVIAMVRLCADRRDRVRVMRSVSPNVFAGALELDVEAEAEVEVKVIDLAEIMAELVE